ERPKSGIYKIESPEGTKELVISHNWVSLENKAFNSHFKILPDEELNPFSDPQFADQVQVVSTDSINFELHFYRNGQGSPYSLHEILARGAIGGREGGKREGGTPYPNSVM